MFKIGAENVPISSKLKFVILNYLVVNYEFANEAAILN